MSGLTEIPTDDLLSFQDYPTVHSPNVNSSPTSITISTAPQVGLPEFEKTHVDDPISTENINTCK